MILKLTAIACGIFLLGFGITAALKTPQEYTKDKSIASLAQRAKNQGKTHVTVPGKIINYPGMNMGLDEALQNYSVVITEPIESNSFITDSSDEIRTVNKFRIVETLSQRNAVFCNTCPALNDVSAKLQPALHNEFILELSGGTVTVNDVEVTYGERRNTENFGRPEISHVYLFYPRGHGKPDWWSFWTFPNCVRRIARSDG